MRQTIGGTWIFQLMLLFILLFAAFIILTLNYSRTVRVKNELIDMIEKYEGLNDESIELVNDYLNYTGQTTQGVCVDEGESNTGVYGAYDLASNELEEADPGVKYYYCVKKYNGANTTNYYQISIFYQFNLPIIGQAGSFEVRGTTSNFQSHDNEEYCYSTSGTCTSNSNQNSGNNNNNTVTYTVSFNLDGGQGNINSQRVSQGGLASTPATSPTKAGYTFGGWQLNGRDYNFNTPVYSNITLVAKWETETYALVYDFDGGLWGNRFTSMTDYCTTGENVDFSGMFTSVRKSGFTLDYFIDSNGNTYTSSNARFTCQQNMNLRAVWR